MEKGVGAMQPKVSVLMPVYNAAPYLRAAIDSILAQTFTNFEFLIVNDGSTDDSTMIIDSYQDSRISHVKLSTNRGIVEALNTGLELARGEYVARMDADDISLPTRLYEQVSFMDKNPDIGLSGTLARIMNEKFTGQVKKSSLLKAFLLIDNIFVHSSVILSKRILSEAGLKYDSKYKHNEDYHLWFQLSRLTKLAQLPLVLIEYRISETQISTLHNKVQWQFANEIRRIAFEGLLKRTLTEEERIIVSKRDYRASIMLKNVLALCWSALKQNDQYEANDLRNVLGRLIIRNIYDIKFKISDFFRILVCELLSLKERASILKSLSKSLLISNYLKFKSMVIDHLLFNIRKLIKATQFRKQQKLSVADWTRVGKPYPPPKAVKQSWVRETGEKYGIRVLIETGTYKGEMVYAQFPFFKGIHSIELSESLFEKANVIFKSYSNVKLWQGDSGQVLRTVMAETREPAVIWLDAHYSAGITARGEIDCPIYDELKVISESPHKHAILVDDAVDFVGKDGYPTKDELRKMCNEYFPSHSFEELDGIFRILPSKEDRVSDFGSSNG